MLLEVNDVTVSYGQTPVLFGANLAVNQGEIACILGRNGVGKTTLLRSIIGLKRWYQVISSLITSKNGACLVFISLK